MGKYTLKYKKEEVIKYYLDGHSQEMVGKKFNVTQGAICDFLKRNNVIIRKYDKSGSNNPNWKGGIIYDGKRKLIFCPKHPNPDHSGIYCYEYRLIIEKHLGRYLNKNEIVHHINNDVTDNRIENLQLMTQSEHIKLHYNRGDMNSSS